MMFFEPKPDRRRSRQLRLSERRFVLRIGDVLTVCIAVLLSLLIWTFMDQNEPDNGVFFQSKLFWLIVLPVLWLLLATVNDFYDLQLLANHAATINKLFIINAQLVVLYLVIFFLSPPLFIPRLFILYYSVLSFVLITVWRGWTRPLIMDWTSVRRRAMIVGADWGAETIIKTVQDYALAEYMLVGVVAASKHVGRQISGVEVLGSGLDLSELVVSHDVGELIVATPAELTGDLFQGVMDCYQQGISIVPMAILYERLTGRVPVELVGKDWAIILPIETASIFDPYPLLKRLFDVVVSLLGLLLFAVILPFIALVIYLDSPGSIFFSQVRVGKSGRLFDVIKLRTMIPNAEAESGAQFATQNDPRITRVGRFLRKSRLDEVPQLWNVLKGDMSLIGPRPERPEFIDDLTKEIPFYRARLAIRPGVSGWAQVRGDYAESLDGHLTKLQYDLYYIRHRSVLLDLQIGWRTVGKMISFSGQ